MRLVYIIALGLAGNILQAGATAYINEGFEGTFPPAGWTVEKTASADWQQEPNGPWGNQALGWASASHESTRWARLTTFAFDVPAGTNVEYRYDYRYFCSGYPAPSYARFTLYYVGPPEEKLAEHDMSLSGNWREFAGEAAASRAGSLAARFELHVSNPTSHISVYGWSLDNVLVNDKREHAVAPTSLGRVRALYR